MKSPQVQKKNLMGIKNRITLAFVLFLIIPIILLVITSATNFGRLGNNVSEISGQALETEEYRSINEITESKAAYVDTFFTKKGSNIKNMDKFAEDLFNGKIEYSAQDSYYHTEHPTQIEEEFSEIYNRSVSFDISMYFTADGDNLTPKSENNRDISVHLDVMFKQLEANDNDYTWRYMGFEEIGRAHV